MQNCKKAIRKLTSRRQGINRRLLKKKEKKWKKRLRYQCRKVLRHWSKAVLRSRFPSRKGTEWKLTTRTAQCKNKNRRKFIFRVVPRLKANRKALIHQRPRQFTNISTKTHLHCTVFKLKQRNREEKAFCLVPALLPEAPLKLSHQHWKRRTPGRRASTVIRSRRNRTFLHWTRTSAPPLASPNH